MPKMFWIVIAGDSGDVVTCDHTVLISLNIA